MRASSHVPISAVVCAFLFSGCGGGDDGQDLPTNPEEPAPEETGLIIDNASTYTLSEIFVRTCGTRPWSTQLSDTSQTAPDATRTFDLPPGCYDIVAVTRDDQQSRHRHAPDLQVVEGEATRLALATTEFQMPDSTESCASTEDHASGAFVVGTWTVMDAMLIPEADAFMRQEFAYQTAFFNLGVETAFFGMMDEHSPNAMASPLGFIAFGDYFYLTHGQEHGAAGVQGILAHEYGHRVQHVMGWVFPPNINPEYLTYGESVFLIELEADAFSGYYMAHPYGKNASEEDLLNVYKHAYSTGSADFAWNVPDWHGTSVQRLAASILGAQTAYTAYQNGLTPTYADLHAVFMQSIINDIALNPNPVLRSTKSILSPKMQEFYARLPHARIRAMARGE
jgi:hypothetical protein